MPYFWYAPKKNIDTDYMRINNNVHPLEEVPALSRDAYDKA